MYKEYYSAIRKQEGVVVIFKISKIWNNLGLNIIIIQSIYRLSVNNIWDRLYV